MNLVLWWHMHQPDYRDVSGEFMLPWVYLHAVKDYIDMPLNIMANPGMKANINITPVLISQWRDYNYLIEKALNEEDPAVASRTIPDPFLRPLVATRLEGGLKTWMREHYRWSNYDKMVSRYENYRKIFDLAASEENLHYLNDNFYFDLCVWFHISWCGEWIKRYDPFMHYFISKGQGFTLQDRRLFLKRLNEWMKYGLTLYGFSPLRGEEKPSWPPEYPDLIDKETLEWLKIRKKGIYQVTLSPYSHPIIPLLIDVHSGAISAQITDIRYEPCEISNYAQGMESAKAHMDFTARYFEEGPFNLSLSGGNSPAKSTYREDRWEESKIKVLWPSEGSVSSQALELFNEYGINICASGEEVLSISVGLDVHNPIFMNGRNSVPLYKVYKWKDTNLRIIFRDSGLSDLIGFTYARWRGDDAANDLVRRLNEIDDFDKDALVSIILDGENAWEYYYENGFYFLNDFYSLISSSVKITPILLEEVCHIFGDESKYLRLDYIYPGSWINGNFRMWIGEKEKNKAWEFLNKARETFLKWKNTSGKGYDEKIRLVERQLMAAEGSDWFWWLGKDNPVFSQTSMEKIFRNYLKNIYRIMDEPVPDYIYKSLASTENLISEAGGIMKRGAKQPW